VTSRLLTALTVTIFGGACGSHSSRASAHHHHSFSDAQAWANVLDDPARDAWQRPDDVLRALHLTPTMTIADVGAGTGYFAVRLARAVPRGQVIATDLEPDMVRFLNERAHRDQLPNLRAIPATETASGLAPHSVDRILIVHVWHHLTDRVDYARHLATTLRPGGKLFIVDFTLTAQRGPPANMRIAPEQIIAELEQAGWAATLSPVTLPDQYIVVASASAGALLGRDRGDDRPGGRLRGGGSPGRAAGCGDRRGCCGSRDGGGGLPLPE